MKLTRQDWLMISILICSICLFTLGVFNRMSILENRIHMQSGECQ